MRRRKNGAAPTLADEEAKVARLEALARRQSKAAEEIAVAKAKQTDALGEIIAPDNEDASEDIPTPEEVSAHAELSEALDALGDNHEGFKVHVARRERDQFLRVGLYPVAGIDSRMEEIAREGGGGEYRLQFKNAKGYPVKTTTLYYDPKFYKPEVKPVVPNADNSLLTFVVAQLQAVQAQNAELMRAALSGNRNENPLIKSAADLQAMMSALGLSHNKGSDSMGLLEALKIGVELGKQSSEGGVEPGDFLSRIGNKLVDQLGPQFINVLAQAAQRQPAAALPPAAPLPVGHAAPALSPANPTTLTAGNPPSAANFTGGVVPAPGSAPAYPPAPAAGAGATLSPEASQVKKPAFADHPLLHMYKPAIFELAESKQDHEAAAETLLENLPAAWHPKAAEFLDVPDVVAVLAEYDPKVRLYASWFKGVAEKMVSFIKDDLAEAAEVVEAEKTEAPAGVSGNGTH